MGALADALLMDRTTLSRNLKPLEKGGILRVARSPEDARVRLVFLTRAGEQALQMALPYWEAAQRCTRSRLGAKRMEKLRRDLDRASKLLLDAAKAAPRSEH